MKAHWERRRTPTAAKTQREGQRATSTASQPGATLIQGNRRPREEPYNSSSDDEPESPARLLRAVPVQAELAPSVDQLVQDALQASLPQAATVAPTVWKGKSIARFADAATETRFQREHSDLLQIPGALFLLSIQPANIFWYFWDNLQPGVSWTDTLYIRLFLAAFLFLYSGLLVHVPSMKPWYQPLNVVFYSVCLAIICTTFLSATDGFVLMLPGLCMAVISMYSCCIMLFRPALVFTLVVSGTVNVFIYLHNNTSGNYSKEYVFINANMMILSSCSVGLMPVYFAELYLRHRFRRTGTISYWIDPGQELSVELQPRQ